MKKKEKDTRYELEEEMKHWRRTDPLDDLFEKKQDIHEKVAECIYALPLLKELADILIRTEMELLKEEDKVLVE